MSDAPHTGAGSAPSTPPAKGGSKTWLWIIIAIVVVVVVPIALCGGCCVCGGGAAVGLLKSSEPYQSALNKAKSDPHVIEHLGEPIEDATFPTKSEFNDQGDTGNAHFTFTISGPNGSATVDTEAIKEGGAWKTTVLTVTFDGDHTHDLLSGDSVEDTTPEMDDDSATDGEMPEDGAADGETPEDSDTDSSE